MEHKDLFFLVQNFCPSFHDREIFLCVVGCGLQCCSIAPTHGIVAAGGPLGGDFEGHRWGAPSDRPRGNVGVWVIVFLWAPFAWVCE